VPFGFDGPTGFANPRLGLALAAGTGSTAFPTVALSNSPTVTFGAQFSASSIIITATAPVAGISTAIQSISAGTTQITTGQAVLSNSAGVLWGANGRTITAGVPQVSVWQNHPAASSNVKLPMQSNISNVFLNRVSLFNPIAATRAILTAFLGNASNGGAYTLQLGIYTLNHSTASLASTASITVAWNGTGTNTTDVAAWSGQSDTRARSIPLGTWNMSAGEYLLAILGSFTAVGASQTWSFNGTAPNAIITLGLGSGPSTQPYFPPRATYSAATSTLPNSIQVADLATSINQNAQLAVPSICFVGTF